MKTKKIYYHDPYKKETKTVVVDIQENARSLLSGIILDQTVFFPEGGGQPGDRGEIIGKKGSLKIEYTRLVNGQIIHQGKMTDELRKGDQVTAKIDWNWRYKYMKIHSAGHLVHDVLMSMVEGLKPFKGSHGKKAYLEYEGEMDISLKEELEIKVNEAIQKDLSVLTKEATYDELVKECQFLPPNLPKDKMLRMLKIGDFPAMPDGGIHVKSTKEISKVLITDLLSQEGKVRVKYRVIGGQYE